MKLINLYLTITVTVAAAIAVLMVAEGVAKAPLKPVLASAPAADERIPTDPIGDGCFKTLDPLDMIKTDYRDRKQQPWVYVNNDRVHYLYKGTVTSSRISPDDLYSTHEWRDDDKNKPPKQPNFLANFYINHDVNYSIKPDPGYEKLLAKGNYYSGEGPEDAGTLKFEYAVGEWALNDSHKDWKDFYPMFAMPQSGDRIEAYGALIWDCNHGWEGSGGMQKTEFHPPAWVHVSRKQEAGYEFKRNQPSPARVHDIYANSNRQLSGIIAEWELTKTEEQRQDDRVQSGSQTFYLEAPPKPSDSAQLRYAEAKRSVRAMKSTGKTAVTPYPNGKSGQEGPGIEVQIANSGKSVKDLGYAARWYVGWDQKTAQKFKKVRVAFSKVTCYDDHDDLPWNSGEFHLYFHVANDYYYSFDYGLDDCDSGQTVDLSPQPTVTTTVPANQRLLVEAGGYENDDPACGEWLGAHVGRYQLGKWRSKKFTERVNDYDYTFKVDVLSSFEPEGQGKDIDDVKPESESIVGPTGKAAGPNSILDCFKD